MGMRLVLPRLRVSRSDAFRGPCREKGEGREGAARSPWLAVAVALVFFLVSASGKAQIYRWSDATGREHFTQDLNQVPARHREAARKAAARPGGRDPLQSYSAPQRAAPAARARHTQRGGTHEIHFRRYGTLMMVEVELNDHVRAPFLADTGASGISIPHAVAQELGIRIDSDTPTVIVGTANGNVEEPLVALESVQVGSARVEGLRANVSGSMQFGLLGGSFFNNFIYQVDAAARVIRLTPNEAVRGGLARGQWQERFQQIRAPLSALEARLESGVDRRAGRVRELETRLRTLHEELARLESRADRAEVPQGWRE